MYQKVDERKGIIVVARENEDIESLIKRFKKKVNKSGILRELKIKSHYEKPSEHKKRKMNESRLRTIKDQLKLDKIKKKGRKKEDDSNSSNK
jgi:small subunit ribosomal protein S21